MHERKTSYSSSIHFSIHKMLTHTHKNDYYQILSEDNQHRAEILKSIKLKWKHSDGNGSKKMINKSLNNKS